MKTFFATLGTVAMLVTGMAANATPASADQYYGNGFGGRHYGGDRYYRHGGGHGGDALAAGVIGLGVGALIGGALASDRPTYYEGDRRYYEPAPRYYRPAPRYYEAPVRYRNYDQPVYYENAPVRYQRLPIANEPVYRRGYSHADACAARYRSYDHRSDTFVGYDGRLHRCNL